MAKKKALITDKHGLCVQERNFLDEYRQTGDAATAIRKAFGHNNLARPTLMARARSILNSSEAQAYMNETWERVSRLADVGQADVARALAGLMEFDIKDVLDDDGGVKPPQEWPVGASQAIKMYKAKDLGDSGIEVQIATHDKIAAATALMRHVGGFEKDNAQKHISNTTVNIESLTNNMSPELLQAVAGVGAEMAMQDGEVVEAEYEEVPP